MPKGLRLAAIAVSFVLSAAAFAVILMQMRSIERRIALTAIADQDLFHKQAEINRGKLSELSRNIDGLNSAIGTVLSASRVRLPDTEVRTYTGNSLPFGGADPKQYKTTTDCHAAGRTMVLVAIGQSNAANYAGSVYRSRFGGAVSNYFSGACYVAEDPLLGADGNGGSPWVKLANDVIAAGLYDRVVIAPVAVGGTSIERWRRGGDLNDLITRMLESLKANKLDATHVFWVQGEADRFGTYATTAGLYMAALAEVVETVRSRSKAPIFIATASSCPSPTDGRGPAAAVRTAQIGAVNEENLVFAGPDLDAISAFDERFDLCHLTAHGVAKFDAQAMQAIQSAGLASSAARPD